jgi:hypothetical protein
MATPTFDYIWSVNTSNAKIDELLRTNGKLLSDNTKSNRVALSKLYKSSFSTEEQRVVSNPDFEKIMLDNGYRMALYKMNYTTLRVIWDLNFKEVVALMTPQTLSLFGDTPPNPRKLNEYKLLLAKQFQREGRLFDAKLLTIPNSSNILLKYGVEGLRELQDIKDVGASHFDDLGLAGLMTQFMMTNRHLYLADNGKIVVIDPKSHEVIRTITNPLLEGLRRILGYYNDLLYVLVGDIVYTVTLNGQTVTPVDTQVGAYGDTNLYIYKGLMCYQVNDEDGVTVEDLETGQILWVLGAGELNHNYDYHGKYLCGGEIRVCYDITTGQKRYMDKGAFIGVVDENTLFFDDDKVPIAVTLSGSETTYPSRDLILSSAVADSEGSFIGYNGEIYVIVWGLLDSKECYQIKALKTNKVLYHTDEYLSQLYVDRQNHQLIAMVISKEIYRNETLIFVSIDDGFVVQIPHTQLGARPSFFLC